LDDEIEENVDDASMEEDGDDDSEPLPVRRMFTKRGVLDLEQEDFRHLRNRRLRRESREVLIQGDSLCYSDRARYLM